jgi:hypothetical protein
MDKDVLVSPKGSEDFFFDRMNELPRLTKRHTIMTRSLVLHHIVPALSLSLFVAGCASFSGTAPRTVVSQSYDLPGTLDANAVIRAVERAFVRTLAKPPRIIEGSVPSPLPAMPAPFTVEDRQVHLDRLGMVSLPEVICPESMAVVQALVADMSESSGPHSYTGCIQLYAGGYRVSVVDSRLVVGSSEAGGGATASGPRSEHGRLTRIAQALREEVLEARLVADTRAQEAATPVWRIDATSFTDHESSTRARIASFGSPPERSAAIHEADREDAVSTLPLVCLAPRHESAPVRAARGEGRVITVLSRGSIVAVAEPVDAAYFRVETEGGTVGWVNHADVRRLTCPIG